jgi:cyclopropane-fatty-acyl-phospholipid synthase
VRAFNISHEQVAYARERAEAEGLGGQIEYIEDDYRNISGQYDAFASVGMLEHVGVKHYPELGVVIDRCLKPEGRGLIHSIGQNTPCPTSEWTQQRIFPGGYAPALREMLNIFERSNFSVLDVENLRLHYARTLRHWLERFDQQHDRVRQMYDEAFIRAWRLYLCGSIANFSIGKLQLFQVLIARPGDNSVPMSRDFIYSGENDNAAL